MRWTLLLAFFACACSFDWSLAGSGGGGASGAGGGAAGKAGAGAGGGTAGVGGAPSTGGAGGTCSGTCLGQACGAKICDGKIDCCAANEECASVDGTTDMCVPTGCANGSNIQCQKACPDLCSHIGLDCCKSTGFCADTSDQVACPP